MASATALETLPVELRGLASGVLQQGYAVGYLIAAVINLVRLSLSPLLRSGTLLNLIKKYWPSSSLIQIRHPGERFLSYLSRSQFFTILSSLMDPTNQQINNFNCSIR